MTRLGTPARVADYALLALCRQLAAEVASIAAAQGFPLDEADLAAAGSAIPIASARPSMLQDVLQSRPLEVEAILGQPQLLGREKGLATPVLDVRIGVLTA